MASSEAAILLKDAQGEKSLGKIGGFFKSSNKTVYRGELLILLPRVKVVPRKDNKPAHNYQLASDPSVTLFCPGDDVAPLSDYEYSLMVGVKSREARFEVFRKDILDWGSKLKAGTFVRVALPSKTPVSNQRAVSVIRYVGPLPNENGIQFGVEIQEEQYRHQGSSNGFFGGEQYFECEDNCALFVSLDRLSPMDQDPQPEPPPPVPTDPQRQHQMTTRSQGKPQQGDPHQRGYRRDHSPKRLRPRFKMNERVVVHNKRGVGIHGAVRWIQEVHFAGDKMIGVGIETDVAVQSKDFEGALTGFSQHFKCSDHSHGKIAMPESMVVSEKLDAAQRDKQKEKYSAQGTSVDAHAKEHEDAHVQYRDVQQAVHQREDEYLKDALHTGRIDRDQQIRLMREFEKTHKGKQQNAPGNQQYVDPNNPQSRYGVIPGAADYSNQPPYQNYPSSHPSGSTEQNVQPSTGASSARGRPHAYESPDRTRRELLKMRDQHSVQDEHLLGANSGRGGASNVQLRQQRSMPAPGGADDHQGLQQVANNAHQPHVQHCNPSNLPLYGNIPGSGGVPPQQLQPPFEERHPVDKPALEQLSERPNSDSRVYYQYDQQFPQAGGPETARDFQAPPQQPAYQQQQQQQDPQRQETQGAQQLQEQLLQQHVAAQAQPPHNGIHANNALLQHGAGALVLQETISRSFSMGSTVQLQSDPPRYGVIQWMGTLPGILEGRIAGVELEEPMEGCSDGTWNGTRYFSCQMGHGFFCPMSSLAPDQRFAQTTTTVNNPLEGVAMEESRDQFINPGQIFGYIGEGKGIQGHQNSCYLDSTVFGLFSASDVFDSMFLEQDQGDPAGGEVKHLLWKGIVNPLRKNGVVRYESVMMLRNKLEELGKMKGVNQDEKDPEEFLNMLFKHTLHVPPFINIKRPFGVEQEYFVQLFVEHNESLKLPTVGELLEIMFKEQKIRFTKVPSKLLIQIPRYGREFKTYQKTIPGMKLNLKGLLCSKHQCFICGDTAWKECSECKTSFATEGDVVYFCEKCAELAHGKLAKRDKHDVQEIAVDAGGVNELDLLSVICIETSHYICFTRSEERWVFFDSMANRVNDMYNIPKVVDCTDVLNEWVYPANRDLTRLLNTPPRELPEYVRRFTQDIYLCVYIQPDVAMYGDFEDIADSDDGMENHEQEPKQPKESDKATDADYITMQHEFDELKAKYALIQQQQEKVNSEMTQLQRECTQLKVEKAAHKEELIEMEKREQTQHQQELEQIQDRHRQELQQVQSQHQQELHQMATEKQSVERHLFLQENRILELERKLETATTEAKETRFTQLLNPQGGDSSWNVPRKEVIIREEIGRGASGLVSKGEFRGQIVAVKQIHQFILTQRHVMNEFKREVRIMASVQHPNLVRFIGAVFDESVENLTATPLLLLELLHTNLRKAYEERPSSLGASVMLSIFRDVAYGLHYLHEHQEPIIHRDVSAPNVLLEALSGGTWRAKLSDFGSANFLKRSSTLGVGAIVCTAPEMFPRDDPSAPVPRPTVKCDVFSYGIVVVEVITKTMPSLENRHQLFQEVERKWRMMHDLVTLCTKRRPEDRPTMSIVLNQLNRFPVARPR